MFINLTRIKIQNLFLKGLQIFLFTFTTIRAVARGVTRLRQVEILFWHTLPLRRLAAQWQHSWQAIPVCHRLPGPAQTNMTRHKCVRHVLFQSFPSSTVRHVRRQRVRSAVVTWALGRIVLHLFLQPRRRRELWSFVHRGERKVAFLFSNFYLPRRAISAARRPVNFSIKSTPSCEEVRVHFVRVLRQISSLYKAALLRWLAPTFLFDLLGHFDLYYIHIRLLSLIIFISHQQGF